MVTQTIRLFIKALVIGLLVNGGLQQVAGAPAPTDNGRPLYHSSEPAYHSQTPALAPDSTGN
jgi:hypothetical protein